MEHLKYLNLSGTVVQELPKSICKLKYLEKLDLSSCNGLENFPEILEPMEHLEFLDLRGTTVQELHSSIEFLPALKTLILNDCEKLSSIPKSNCKLKYLKELNLYSRLTFEDFPKILEPIQHLKFLNLNETAIQELHSSIEFLPALNKLELRNCKKLSRISKGICKFKYLEVLDLSLYSRLENFPEMLEPMENLKSLNLSGITVQELHSSIEFLCALETLELRDCKRLSSIPKSICKLKYLKVLDLSWCSELEHFSEILEQMEHLESLDLSGTGVKELPSSLEYLSALTVYKQFLF